MDIIKAFNSVKDVPYRIPLSSEEEDHCCSGKHKRLKDLLKGYKTRYRICDFKWSSLDLPERVKIVKHDDDCTHMYLEVFLDGKWVVVDATWDKGLSRVFEINEWDGKTDTKIAVIPTNIYSPGKSLEILNAENIEEDLGRNGDFYEAFNEWLEDIRKGK